MLRIWFNRIGKFFARRMTLTRCYYINGREVTEAEWYANGGLEAEEELEKMVAEMDKRFKELHKYDS
jgi:hypothetical protein